MTTTTTGRISEDPVYIGRILNGPHSDALKEYLRGRISQCLGFDDTGSPAIFYISAWENAQETIWYEYVSSGFLELFGCDGKSLPAIFRDSILERRVYHYAESGNRIIKEIYSRDELKRIRKALREKGTASGMVEAIYKIATPEGHPRWLKDRANVVLFENDGVCLSVGNLVDVTKEMEAEEQLKMTQLALKAAKDEAETANRVKSEFLANISHEVRTPLNGIMGMCELIERTELDRRQREYVHILRTAARSLLLLINDILDFSKTESGALRLERLPFISRNIMEDIRDIFLERIAEKDIEMRIDLSPDVPEQLIGDPLRLRQVLLNLIDNALKFTKQGSIRISVGTNGIVDGREELIFCVRDTGIGIAPDIQEFLFDAFRQADGSASRKYGGTGLGLAICKRITELMDGSIWVESTPGEGSAFYFTARFRHYTDNGEAEYDVPERIQGLKALIVEDNRSTQFILRRTMESFGCRVVTAFSAEEALAAYESQPPETPFDVILMDIALPGMDGITAAEAIKRVHRLPAPPIIVISASGRDDEIQRAEAAGVDSYLVKPVKKSVLLNTLKEIFGIRLGRRVMADGDDKDLAAQFSGLRILVVEDNPINRRVAREVLKTADIRVDLVDCGKDAVAAAAQQRYDAILMDIQMPGMDGIETTERIRRKLGEDAPPIIAMTAYTMAGDREKFIAAGLSDYIPKPLERRQVFATLRKYIQSVATEPIYSERQIPLPEQILPVAPESLEGLDVVDAMKRFQGNWWLYTDVLDTTCRSVAFQFEETADPITHESVETLAANAGTLKEAAIRIAAPELLAAAAAVIDALDAADASALSVATTRLHTQLATVKRSAERLRRSFNAPTHTSE
ncbi:MAG: response regulator [Pseudomonadota bacterium]